MNVTLLSYIRIHNQVLKANHWKPNMLQKEAKLIKLYSVNFLIILGIKAGRTQNPDELKKLSKQVKDDSFKHPDVGILPVG